MNNTSNKNFITSGHNACSGCGEMVAIRAVMRGLNENVIIANATGCSEVTTTAYPQSAWQLPWIHSLFENAAAVAGGIKAAMKQKGEAGKNIKVLAQGGDGATFDIGTGIISGSWERGDDILYVCYDTESYSNTGIQASGATPYGAITTTTPISDCQEGSSSCPIPSGAHQVKKDMIAIALAHGLNYVAQSTAGFPDDITRKVKRALEIGGPAYIQILSPCIPGWGINSSDAIKLGKLAAQTGLYPLLEYENGKLVSSTKIKEAAPVEDYLKAQNRFKHLFKNQTGAADLEVIKKIAAANIAKYGLQQ